MATAEELGVEDVLEVLTDVFGLDGQVRKKEYNILCPHPDHNDSRPSCDVNLETGQWNCFSCPASGDLVDLGRWVLGTRKRDVLQLLRPDEPDAIRAGIQRRLEASRKAAKARRRTTRPNLVSVPLADSYDDGPLDYLQDRGFKLKTLRRWGVRYAEHVTLFRGPESQPFEIDHAIAIPVLSETEQVLGWCYRATDRSANWFQNVRYIYTPGIHDVLNQHWFGLHLHKDCKEITVVEGALDAMWCDQHGIPAVAILGSQVKQMTKVRKLMDFRKVTILTDRDSAGVTTAYGLGTALQERGIACSVCRYRAWMVNRAGKPAKDAQDLCGMDLELVHARAIPFMRWKHGDNLAA